MSYKNDFEKTSNWNCIDTNSRLDTSSGKKFVHFLKDEGVTTIIRYFASNSTKSKTITEDEAQYLIDEGFWLIPVFQDRNRLTSDFGSTKGKSVAKKARDFAEKIKQPEGSTILFAVDADFSSASIKSHITPYFEAIHRELSGSYRIGAYGSGAVMQSLLDDGLIDVPWLSMSRLFNGTKDFFYSKNWGVRQLPLPLVHSSTGINYDKNLLNFSPGELGAFSSMSQHEMDDDAHLGQGNGSVDILVDTNSYVSTEGLNFREEPNGTIIRPLTIAEPVTDLGAADVTGWKNVEIDGQKGVVFGKYLRQPASHEVEAFIQQTVAQWVRFDKGRAHEESHPYYEYVGEMWQSIGLNYDGRSRYSNGDEVPWSAAFISFVVRKAGIAYEQFKFHESHSQFSHSAIQARILELKDHPFWGYRYSEKKPEIGDIIHRNRGKGKFTYDYAENHSRFKSHSDVVVEVTSHIVRVIGGNVGDTVSMKRFDQSGDNIQEYELDDNGYIASGQKVIAILKNRASEVV